jgi:CRISPR/Cas system type I-B associated protein Csh2 (Cas7 group RAMP superfamily)
VFVFPLQENKHKRHTTTRKQIQAVHHYKKTNTNGTPLQENKHKRYTTTRKQTQTVHYYKKTSTNGTPLQENKDKRYTTNRLYLFSYSGVPFVFVFL